MFSNLGTHILKEYNNSIQTQVYENQSFISITSTITLQFLYCQCIQYSEETERSTKGFSAFNKTICSNVSPESRPHPFNPSGS